MTIEIKLIGFGGGQPARFNGKNRLHIDVETPATVRNLLQSAGIEEASDLIAMDTETVIPRDQWDESRICDRATLTILSAIEGG
jgi:thiamine biosynthesis protein ThiS